MMSKLAVVKYFKTPETVVLSHDLSHQPKYNILELKIRGVIITREYV
jgi:hypothetical protein